MQPEWYGGRGIPPSVVENALKCGSQIADEAQGTVTYIYENVTVVAREGGKFVITVWKTGH